MIFLEKEHKIVKEACQAVVIDGKKDIIEIRTGDFDGSIFHVSFMNGLLIVSLAMRGFRELSTKYGSNRFLSSVYGSFLAASPEGGYDVTLQVEVASLSADDKKKVVETFPLLKRNSFAGPFFSIFDASIKKEAATPLEIPFREEENMYVIPGSESTAIIFALRFKDADDVIFAKVFMQEFADARRDPTLRDAPAVVYSEKRKPLELKSVSAVEGEGIGYVTFTVFKRHIEAAKRDNTLDLLLQFRNYLHYHLKCSKAYMHFRMRNRVTSLLQILNRAKSAAPSEKKTISGRTFTRK